MEEKTKRTPGICRIFSLSLNQAISNKETPISNTSRTSRDSVSTSPENDKANNEKKDGFPDRHFKTDSYPRHGSAYRQSMARSSENKDKRAEADSKGSSNASKESCKKSHLVSSSFSDTKRRVETSRKTVPYSGNISSGKKTVSSSRTQSVGEKSSVCVPLEASSVLQATNTCEENNDIDPAFGTLPSEDATHGNCSESSSIKIDISPQSDKSVSGKRDFDDRGPLKTVHDSSGHVPKDGTGRFNRKQSSSFGSQRETGSSTTEARSHDGQPRFKSISDKKDDKNKKSRNHFNTEHHSWPRKDSYGKQTQNDRGETGKSSLGGQCPKTQTEKRPDHCSGSRSGTYDKQKSQHLSGKWSNRSRGSGYQSAHCKSERGLNKSVSTDYGSRKVSCPPQSASTGRASSGREKGTITGIGRSKYKEYREADWDEVSEGGSSRPNSAGSRNKDDPSIGHTLHSTVHSQVQQRGQNHGTGNVDGNLGKSLPTQHASHSESAEDDLDSKTFDVVESSGVIKTQGDSSAVQDKSQTYSQTESTDTSEVEVWCDVKEDMSKQECGTDMVQVTGSCIENVSTMTVLDTECDNRSQNVEGNALLPWSGTEKPDNCPKSGDFDAKSTTHLAETQPVSIAKMRQANVTTRMRGNSRVKSCINRMKMTDDASRDSAEKEEAHSKDFTKSRCDQHSLVKSVDDTICEVHPSETLEKCSMEIIKEQKLKNAGEKTPVEFLSESLDEDKSSKEPCVQETLDHVNDCSNKNSNNDKVNNFHTSKNQTLTGWKTVPDKSSNSSDFRKTFCDKDFHGKSKDKVVKAPPPLMSLQTKPSASLYEPVVLKKEDYGWSSDSCIIPSNQHHTSLQKSSVGFGRTKVRSGSTVSSSSSSHAPLSTTNSLSQNENLSCSSSSYASLVSDDSKDAVSLETSFSKKEDSKVGGSKWECFSNNHNLPQSSTCSSAGNSKDEEESQAANRSKHAGRSLCTNSHRKIEPNLQKSHDSSKLSCSTLESGVMRQSSEATVFSKLQHSYITDSDSQYQQDKVRTWKGMGSLCSSDDQSACGDADRDQLSSCTFEFDADTHRRTDRISRESSTETVTETPDVEPLSYDANGNQASAENLAGRSVSGASSCFQSNWDSDFQVSSPVYSDEPVLFSKKCIADEDSFNSLSSEYGQVETENVQQYGRSTMFRKQRPGKRFPQTRCKNLEFDQEQVIRNKHGQALEPNDWEASGAANSKMKPPVKRCKETNEKRHARLKDGGDFSLRVQSASSSECSESVSVVSDYVCAGSDIYLKGTDFFDQRCQTWIKETERWPAKTSEGPTESDSNNSFLSDFKEKRSCAAQKHCVYEDESWIDSDACPPLGSLSCMTEDHAEEQDCIESKTSHPAHKHFQPTERAQKQRGRSLHQRTTSTSQDAVGCQSTATFADQECDVSKIRLPRSNLEAKERQTVADRKDSACSKPGHFVESCKNLKCSGTKLCRGHCHSLCDVGNTKIQTSGSSDCDVEVLSQSDYGDSSAQLQGKVHGNEADKRLSSADQSSQASASNEHWLSLYQNHPVPGYPSYIPKTHAQSCYPSYYPETDMWVPPHHSYYEQWYHAWMAYSMGFYGYGFQEGDQDMDFSEAFRRQNCGCASTCHQQHSRPPSRPSSQPPSRPPSSQDNPILRDPRAAHDVNLIQSEKSDSQQRFHGNKSGENSGGQYFPGVRRGEASGRQHFEYFHGDGNDAGSRGQYFQGDRSDESSEVHDRKIKPSSSLQEACSQNVQNHVTKEPPASYGRSNISSEIPAWVKKEEGDPQNRVHEEESSPSQNSSESRNMQNEPVGIDSSGRPNPAEELMNHTNLLREQSMNINGNNFFRCRSKTPVLTPYGPGSRLSQYRGDYSSWPGFSPHAFRPPPPMMMATMMPAFRFCRLPRPYQGFSPPETSPPSSCGGKEEKKETPSPENFPNKQQWYSDYKDLHSVHASNMFHRNMSNEWSLRPQHPLLPQQPVQPSPSSHIPQGPKEMVSQTSHSLEMASSEPCRLDSSFDTRGDYDASSSEVDDASQADTASSKRKRTELSEVGFDKFVAAQRQRYLQMYKDSGSDELDSSSVPSSKQSNTTRLSNDPDENNSSGSGVTPRRQESATKSVLHSLHRRAIPFNSRDRNRRSCPPKVETAPTATPDKGVESEKKTRPWDLGFQTPPPGLSYAQAVSSPGAWWEQSTQSELPLCEEDFPTLSAADSLPTLAALSSGKKTLSQVCNAEEKDAASSANGDVSYESFFRKKSSQQSSWTRGGKTAMSRYASRLMSDNRLSGRSRWGKDTREAFGEAYQTTFIDTHCHLDFLFNREPYKGTYAAYQEKNKSTFPSNYEGCVAVFCRPKSFRNESKWKPIVEEPGVWMAMGCHPKNAPEYTEWTEEGLLKALKHSKTVALGEIGLDYSKHHGQTSDLQKEVFIRQIKIALSMNLPLVIHCREAEDDCLQILEEHVPADHKIHCHCFTTNYESAVKWTSRFKNLFIGLTPLVTYRSAVDVHQVARHLPLNKLLLETDAPYFLPNGFEAEEKSLSHPGMALTVAIRVAELRGIQVEEVLTHVRRNTKEMYGI